MPARAQSQASGSAQAVLQAKPVHGGCGAWEDLPKANRRRPHILSLAGAWGHCERSGAGPHILKDWGHLPAARLPDGQGRQVGETCFLCWHTGPHI